MSRSNTCHHPTDTGNQWAVGLIDQDIDALLGHGGCAGLFGFDFPDLNDVLKNQIFPDFSVQGFLVVTFAL